MSLPWECALKHFARDLVQANEHERWYFADARFSPTRREVSEVRSIHAARMAAATILSIAAVTVIYAGPVSASSTDGQAAAISTTISRAERFEGKDARTLQTATAGTVSATLPTQPKDGVKIHAGLGSDVTIGLPGAASADAGRVAADGTVVYTHAARSASAAAKSLPGGGAQVLVAISGSDAPTEYAFPIGLPAGVQLQASGDGGYFAMLPTGGLIVIAAPWARDASGKSVPTSYRLEGQALIETVAHAGFAYPVVADPNISSSCVWYGMCFIKFNRAYTNNIAAGTGIAAIVVGLTAVSGGTLAPLALVVGAKLGIDSVYANWVYNRGNCMAYQFAVTNWLNPMSWGAYEVKRGQYNCA